MNVSGLFRLSVDFQQFSLYAQPDICHHALLRISLRIPLLCWPSFEGSIAQTNGVREVWAI